ncbi:MAG: hypothetical protein VKJ04_10185 [Vampirovibrionales bacterium]|nr:hypothetical protein [Vampirovibrionales bacterium]
MSVFLTDQPYATASSGALSSGLPRVVKKGNIQPKFGNAATEALKPIKYLSLADKIGNVFTRPFMKRLITSEPNLWNMSMQDWMVRMMLVVCLYVPQAYTSIKKDQHKWETNGRNMVTWLFGLGIGFFLKHDRYSINALLDGLMRPKGTPYELLNKNLQRSREHLAFLQENDLAKKPPVGADWSLWKRITNSLGLGSNPTQFSQEEKQTLNKYRKAQVIERYLKRKIPKLEQRQVTLTNRLGGVEKARQYPGGAFHKLLNTVRLEGDYYDLISRPEVGVQIKRADRYRAFWASLTDLQMSLVHQRIKALSDLKQSGKLNPEELKELKVLKQFTTRISHSRPLRNAMDTTLGIILSGFLLMWIVFKFIAPFDHDFDPDRMPAKLKKKIRESKRKEEVAPPIPSNTAINTNAFASAPSFSLSSQNQRPLSRPSFGGVIA